MRVYFMSFLSPYTPDFPISESISRREPGSLRTEFVQQRLRVLQVGGVEALGKTVVDLGEHRAGLVALALHREQPGEAGGGAEFPRLRVLLGRNFDCGAE